MKNQALIDYLLELADNALIMGHRLSEWTGHGPILEQDIAITNISLDYIGQARNLYQYAALQIGDDCDEDKLAYLRDTHEFKNFLLVEQPNGDWGQTILKVFYFSNYQYILYKQLLLSDDVQLNAIAEKSLKEITYHVRWSGEWVIRLGDGTAESHQRMKNGINVLSEFIMEMFVVADFEKGMGINKESVKEEWLKKVNEIFNEATLSFTMPEKNNYQKGGNHSIHLSEILNEMQYLQRTYPGSTW